MPLADPTTILQSVHATIPGIANAPLALPSAINTGDLPLMVTFPGTGRWSLVGPAQGQDGGWLMVVRQMLTRCYVLPIVEGQGVDEGFQATIPLLQAVGQRYLWDVTLKDPQTGLGQVNKLADLTDNGTYTVAFNGVEYWGFEFRFNVTQKFSLTDPDAPAVPLLQQASARGPAGPFLVPPAR